MADANYRRLSCRTCAITFDFAVRPGRPPVECDDCKVPRKEPHRPTHCQRCNGVIANPRGGKRFCSRTCLLRERDGTKLTREQYREQCKANAKCRFSCVNCGKKATRKLSGTNARKGYANKYCSMACKLEHKAAVQREIEMIRAMAVKLRPPVDRRIPALRALAGLVLKIATRRGYATKPCARCGAPVGYVFGRSRLYCSKDCSRKMPHNVAARKACKAKRTAIQRGAIGADRINPMAVFLQLGGSARYADNQRQNDCAAPIIGERQSLTTSFHLVRVEHTRWTTFSVHAGRAMGGNRTSM